MQWKTFCQIKTVVTVTFGLIFLAVPSLLWSLFGLDASDLAVLLSRMIGVLYVALGVMIFKMRDLEVSVSRKQTAVIIGTADLASGGLFVLAAIQAVVNPLGWLFVASYGLFGAAWFVLK
jgi:hypothetical protein